MSNALLLSQMANLLMLKGKSAEEARLFINQTEFARSKQLFINEGKLEDIHTIDGLVNDLPGLKSITDSFAKQFSCSENFSQAALELKQRQVLLRTGWEVSKGLHWMAGVYLVLLTLILSILQIYVIPTFSEVFAGFGSELPYLTKLFLSQANVAAIILISFWILSISYLWIISRINKYLNRFVMLPSWLFRVPILNSIFESINQCMSLSVYKFLATFDSFVLPEREDWHKRFNIKEQDKCFKWADEYYEHLELAMELNLTNELLEHDLDLACEKYISKSARSMKTFSIIGSILLAIYIGLIVIAMYLPIFTMGAII